MPTNTLISLALGWVLGYARQTDDEVSTLTIGGILDGLNHGPDDARLPSNTVPAPMTPRRNQTAFRRAVLQASNGACVSCGLDVKTLMFEVAELWGDVREGKADSAVYLETLTVYGVDSPKLDYPPALWEADHVTPLHEGGSNDPALNGQFLCLPCHRAKTTAEHIRRFCDHSMFDGDACALCGKEAHAAMAGGAA